MPSSSLSKEQENTYSQIIQAKEGMRETKDWEGSRF